MLDNKFIGDITGEFIIPSYQRGYRWSSTEVNMLLNDIYEFCNNSNNQNEIYCLQPIVVIKKDDKYELVDGQQRLTTIFLIYKYTNQILRYDDFPFNLTYITNEERNNFLNNFDENTLDNNINEFFILRAYKEINKWFISKSDNNQRKITTLCNKITEYFQERVKVIWYEVDENDTNAITMFSRLNIGKIPLTNAELVKAMFLSKDNKNISYERQQEIALQWDNIERELHNDHFWYFLTDGSFDSLQTRIDLLLKLIIDDNNEENYNLFFKLEERNNEYKKNNEYDKLWSEIQQTFLMLKSWYEKHELYHKIGYLITSRDKNLHDIYNLSKGKTKLEFISDINTCIKNSIKLDKEKKYYNLTYENNDDYEKIYRLLLLFNVESTRKANNNTIKFPFDAFYKSKWSLEHIHAQNSKGLNKEDGKRVWLKNELESMKKMICSLAFPKDKIEDFKMVIKDVDNILKRERIGEDFYSVHDKIIGIMSIDGISDWEHKLSNLALLNYDNNAALNNATFDVKRDRLIQMDKRGEFIPICTKNCFLKYYTDSDSNQIYFWSEDDRKGYIENISSMLLEYLDGQKLIEE